MCISQVNIAQSRTHIQWFQTGLQYLEDGEEYANVPCVKAMKAMGTYSKEIRGWIAQAVAMEPTTGY